MNRQLLSPQRSTANPTDHRGLPVRDGASRPVRTLVSWLVFVVACAFAWLMVGPAQLGGRAYYVVVDGPSMEPTYREGDLVIARAKASYAPGDVVAYLPDIGQHFPVIHRIVGTQGEGEYVTQGDNRDQSDGWLATDANIYGAAWLHIPYGGRVIRLLREPTTWLFVAAGLLGIGFVAESWRRRLRGRLPVPVSDAPWRTVDAWTLTELNARYPPAGGEGTVGQGRSHHPSGRPGNRRASKGVRAILRRSASAGAAALALVVFGASAASLAVDGGTLQVFTLPVHIDVPPSSVVATVDVKPDSLQMRSQGIGFTVYIELPSGFDVASIDVGTVVLCWGAACVPAGTFPTEVGDYDGDAVADRMVKLDRQLVISLLGEVEAPADVTFTVSGVVGGTSFSGTDTVQLVAPEADPMEPPGPTSSSGEPSAGEPGAVEPGAEEPAEEPSAEEASSSNGDDPGSGETGPGDPTGDSGETAGPGGSGSAEGGSEEDDPATGSGAGGSGP